MSHIDFVSINTVLVSNSDVQITKDFSEQNNSISIIEAI